MRDRRIDMHNQWNGKKWFCYGTSMTDNTQNTGFYSAYLAEYAGLEEHNYGKANSGIVPSLHGEDNIKSRVMCLSDGKGDADLITVEVIPNDMKAPLGEVTDIGDDTFCGNLNQILEYLLVHTDAVVVVLIATRGRYEFQHIEKQYTPCTEYVQDRLQWESAVETICKMHGIPCWNGAAEGGLGYFRVSKDNTFVQDQIHLTKEGGRVLANYYWGKLQNLYP